MGEVVVELKLENSIDRELFLRGLMKEEDIRSMTVRAIVDTGAAMRHWVYVNQGRSLLLMRMNVRKSARLLARCK